MTETQKVRLQIEASLLKGMWFCSEPIGPTRLYLEKKKIPPVREGLPKYSVVHKILIKNDGFYDIRIPNAELNNEQFGGVCTYEWKDVSCSIEDGVYHFHLPADPIFVLSPREFEEDAGYVETVTPSGRIVRHKDTVVNIPQLREAIIGTELLTAEEFDFCDSPDVAVALPRIKFTWQSEELVLPEDTEIIILDHTE